MGENSDFDRCCLATESTELLTEAAKAEGTFVNLANEWYEPRTWVGGRAPQPQS